SSAQIIAERACGKPRHRDALVDEDVHWSFRARKYPVQAKKAKMAKATGGSANTMGSSTRNSKVFRRQPLFMAHLPSAFANCWTSAENPLGSYSGGMTGGGLVGMAFAPKPSESQVPKSSFS